MTSLWILGAIVCVMNGCMAGETPEYEKECTVWDNINKMLDKEPTVTMSCVKNAECTGFDCSGKYIYQGMYSGEQAMEVDYCFGMAIHPCSNPVDLHFYIDMPDRHNAHYQHTINGTTNVEIPGLRYDLGEMGYALGYVSVNMSRRTLGGQPYVKIGMRFMVRIVGPVASIGEWPEELQRQFVPNTFVPVPPCDRGVSTPTNNPKTCQKYNPAATVSPPPTTSGGSGTSSSSTYNSSMAHSTVTIPTTQEYRPGEETTGKSCRSTTKAYECGDNEMCDEHKHCKCIPGFQLRESDSKCMPKKKRKEEEPGIIPDPYANTPIIPEKGSKGVNALVIGLSVAGVILLVIGAVGVFMFFRYKKHQQRYGQHELLANTDDDEPLDVST